MRTIKFRVWDNQFKKWGNAADVRINASNGHVHGKFSTGNVEDWKLLQFTGLLDKNGEEIYEGDILSYRNFDKIIVVEYAEHVASYVGYTEDKTEGCYPLARDVDELEVIGNIYQNPELFEVKNA